MKLRWCTINGSPASSGQSWGGLSFQATKLPSSSSDSTCITASLQADDMHRTSWPSESLYNVQTHMEALSHDTVISNGYRPHSSLTSIACMHFSCLTHAFFPHSFSLSIHLFSPNLSHIDIWLQSVILLFINSLCKSCIFTFCCLPTHAPCSSALSLLTFDWGSDLRLRAPRRLHISEMDSPLWFTER